MTFEFITLGVYLIFLLVLGAIFSRFNRNLSDFVRGGAQGSWWMVGTSTTMAGISAFTFTGNGSAVFNAGLTPLVIYLANLAALAIGGLFLAKWFRQSRAYTPMDIIRERYGTPVEQFSVFAGLVLGPLSSAIQLWALAVFVSSTFGLPLKVVIVVVGLIVLFYSVSGGRWAVMATDSVQGIVLFGITLIVGFLALREVGGVSGLIAHYNAPELSEAYRLIKPEGEYADNKYTWQWAIVIFVMQLVGLTNIGSAGPYLSVKDGREGSRAAWWSFGLMAIGCTVWFIPPMVARFLYRDEVMALGGTDPATGAYAVVAAHVLPNGLMGVMIAAMFAATMSSMDTGINGQTGIIVNNLIARIREATGRAPLGDRALVRLCRLISTALGLLVISMSLLLASQEKVALFDTFLLIGSVVGTPILMPLVVGLVIRRLASWSYFVIAGMASIPSVYSFVDARITGNEWSIQERGAWVVGFALLGSLISIPLARFQSPPQRRREQALFEKMATEVDFEAEVGGSKDGLQALLVGRVTTVLGAFSLLILFLPNSIEGRLIILGLNAFILGVGGLLILAGRRSGRLEETSGAGPSEAQSTQ